MPLIPQLRAFQLDTPRFRARRLGFIQSSSPKLAAPLSSAQVLSVTRSHAHEPAAPPSYG